MKLVLIFVLGLCFFTQDVFSALILAIVTNSLVESLTDQIDNLILPLVTFDVILSARLFFN